MKLTAVRLFVMITKLGLMLLFGASIIIIIAILIVDISDNPTTALAYQFGYALTELEQPPLEVNCDELYTAYLNDEEAADANYKYKRLSFSNVEVTEVTTYDRLSGGEFIPYISCFSSNNIMFQLNDPYIMQSVEVGYILNIVGECRGLSQDYIMISDCWANSVSGDLGPVSEIPLGY